MHGYVSERYIRSFSVPGTMQMESHDTAGLSLACGFPPQLNSTRVRWRRETHQLLDIPEFYILRCPDVNPSGDTVVFFITTADKTHGFPAPARASSLPSTIQGQTWFRHKHAVSTLRVTSLGSMYLKTARGIAHSRIRRNQKGTKTKATDRTRQLAYSVHNVMVDACTPMQRRGRVGVIRDVGRRKVGYQ